MPVFPQLGLSKIITQRPYTYRRKYHTISVDMPSGRRWSYSLIQAGLPNFPVNPLGEFEINLPVITDDERDVLLAFYRARKGMYEEFEFFDPGGNLVLYSEDFSNPYWTGSFSGSLVADPWGGSRGRSSSGGAFSGAVAPNGGVSGYRMCASIWCKPAGNSSINIALSGGGSTTTTLKGGTWTRAFHSADVGGGIVSVTFDPGGSMSLFGAQVAPMVGEGSYVSSPGNYGWHEHCRFNSDELRIIRLGPNYNSVSIPVMEFFP